MVTDVEGLRMAMRAMSNRVWRERQDALSRCQNSFEIADCKRSYARPFSELEDQIGPRYGLSPKSYYPRYQKVRGERVAWGAPEGGTVGP